MLNNENSKMNNVAFIIDNINDIDDIDGINDLLEMFSSKSSKSSKSHIYLIGDYEIDNSNITIIKNKNTDIDTQSRVIYCDMFLKRLIHVQYSDNCKEIASRIDDMSNLCKSFSLNEGATESIKNFWLNLPHIIDNPNIDSLKNIFKDKPIILVNSGPSLNKNIHILKDYQNKVIIVACGSAIGALYKNNIKPHFVITIDPFDLMKQTIIPFSVEETTLITSVNSNYKVTDTYPGQKIFFYNNYCLEVANDFNELINVKNVLSSSVTVTTSALSFAHFIGADPIIFIGQDMSFEEKVHADGIEELKEDICEIKSIDGKMLKSTFALKDVFNYFNSVVPNIKDTKIINATEGGAGIKGSKIMTLQEVADKYFINEIESPNILYYKIDKILVFEKILEVKDKIDVLFEELQEFKILLNQSDIINKNEMMDDWFENIVNNQGYCYLKVYLDYVWFYIISNNNYQYKLDLFNNVEDFMIELLDLIEKQIVELNIKIEKGD